MNGLVMSALCLEFERDCFDFDDEEREATLRAFIREGVRGVLASERERWRAGVFGCDIGRKWGNGQTVQVGD